MEYDINAIGYVVYEPISELIFIKLFFVRIDIENQVVHVH